MERNGAVESTGGPRYSRILRFQVPLLTKLYL